jgi:predicted GNAT superfamily acetyltransferase
MEKEIEIRECLTLDELAECVDLQRDVFALPEVELSPVRHFIVTKNAGGFALGAYDGGRLVGFVLSVPAILRGERAFYSHMTGVRFEYQSYGIGARLKWAQRTRSLDEGVRYIKWTFEPVKARNAYFNLEKLGAVVHEYQPNFYGTDYATATQGGKNIGLASDRLFAEWDLESLKVRTLATGDNLAVVSKPERTVAIMNDWQGLIASDPAAARLEQIRIRTEFENAFAAGLVGRGFQRDDKRPAYLLYK